MNTRLKQFLSVENISQSQFADTINVVRASVSHVLSGRNKPGYDFIKAIMIAYPNLNIEWLMMGKGKMYKTVQEQPLVQEIQQNSTTEDELLLFDYNVMDAKTDNITQVDTPVELPVLKPAEFLPKDILSPVNQRKATKVVIFFDDGTFQEL